MMSGLDYSKWDKMAREVSDSDEDGDNIGNIPQVTAFDKPQSVTFGGAASSANPSQGSSNDISSYLHMSSEESTEAGPADKLSVVGSKSTAESDRYVGANSAPAGSLVPKIPKAIDDARLAENGMAVRQGDQTTDGQLSYVWRQTRSEVTVVVPSPPEIRSVDVVVSLSPKPETIAEGVVDLIKVAVTIARGRGETHAARTSSHAAGLQHGCRREEEETRKEVIVLLEGELSFPVKLDGERDVDWELKDFPGTIVSRAAHNVASSTPNASSAAKQTSIPDRRGIEVTLAKHSPIPGVAFWWKSLLKGGPEIDVSAIQGRPVNKHRTAWEEALGMYKENIAKRKAQGKIPIDIGEDG